MGARADELFEEITEGSQREEALEERGVFLLLSRKPALAQVRAGKELHALARWGGVTAGPDYIAKQSLAAGGDFDSAAGEIIPWLGSRLPVVANIPTSRKFLLNDIMSVISSELEELGLPSESFYGSS